ncbi:MAG: hypothetical protein M3308_08225 [Actinomycetota bacterium]|nr:hypothetical protein [Actinomycetota bacterium]
MPGPGEPSERFHGTRGTGQLLFYGCLGLVVAAAAALALGADDTRLLRMGILASLWAALLGAFAAAKMRREVASGSERAEDLRTIYRLELEREIAARREHELVVERELRREAREDSRHELEELRAELRSLRESLRQLFGGELLVERVAVRAESTRVRSLPEQAPPPRRPRALEQVPEGVAESPPLPRRDPQARADSARRPYPQAGVPPPASRSASSRVPKAPPTGAHSDVRSVSDLLAAYGTNTGPRHRRRRENS